MTDPIRDALTHLITEIDLLAAASEGVSGLDMNGGLEPWSSLLEGGKSSIWLGDAIAAGRAALAAQPPADAPSPALDLDALLSPEGAYQRGTGQEDGAQLVDQLEWWAPLYGCETLDNLLHQLRARILPHLRPPVAGIDVPGPDGDYGNVIDLCAAEGVDYRVGVPLLKRARQAWKVAAQPPAPYVRPLAIEAGDAQQDHRSWLTYFEVGGNCGGGAKLSQENCRSLATLLRSLSPTLLRQPAPAVLPVAERPWEREGWCDADGRCWWSHGPTPTARWSLLPMDGMDDAGGWLLPHSAIPIPQPPQGGEVA